MNTNASPIPKASIVVPCYNAEKTVAQCAEGCLRQDYPNLEIIFVDDGSTDSTSAILSKYDGIQVLTQDNSGAAAARNLGWQASSGQIIGFTDSDCVPNPKWMSRLVESYTGPTVGGIGGSYDIANPGSWLARCIHEEIRVRHSRMPRQVNYLGSFNVSYRRPVLEQISGFDERFRKASAEDNDLSYQVRKLGYVLLFDKSNCVAHHHTECLWHYMRQQFWHGYWRIMLYAKQPGMMGGDHYAGLFDFLQLPLSLLVGLAWMASWLSRLSLLLALSLSALLLGCQIPMTAAVVRSTGEWQYVPFALVTVARAFVRGVGMVHALVRSSLTENIRLAAALLRTLGRLRPFRSQRTWDDWRRRVDVD